MNKVAEAGDLKMQVRLVNNLTLIHSSCNFDTVVIIKELTKT
jgi:hypothetical protein